MRSILFSTAALLPILAACSSDTGGATNMAGAGAATSGSSSTAATSGGGGSTTRAGSGGNGTASGSGGSSTTAGASGAPAASGAAGSSGASAGAGTTGTTGKGGATAATSTKECDGKALPPRAQNGFGPYAVGPETAGLAPYWPTADWQKEDPAKLGFEPAKLTAAVDYSTGSSSNQAVLVIRHGYIAAEKYYGSFRENTQHESYSMAKSFTSGLIGIAIAEGKIPSLDTRICDYYSEWNCDDMSDPRSRITIDHALNLKTGLQWQENWRSDATGVNDGISTSLDGVLARKSAEEPGVRQRYSTGDPALMSGIIQKATGMTALEYAKTKVFDVIGTPGIRWNADSKGRTTTFAGLQATAREYAKYGYLYLNYGKWDGKQVVPEDYVKKTTQATKPCTDWVQYLWHVNPPTRLGVQPDTCAELFCQPTDYVDLPADGFFAEGVQGQFVYVVPSADLVIVRFASDGFMASELWDDYSRGFLLEVLAAIK